MSQETKHQTGHTRKELQKQAKLRRSQALEKLASLEVADYIRLSTEAFELDNEVLKTYPIKDTNHD